MKEIYVTLDLKSVTVNLRVEDNLIHSEILELAKKAYLEKLATQFPDLSYSISDAAEGRVLDFADVFVGKVVKEKGSQKYGVVTQINQSTIDVALYISMGFSEKVFGHPISFVEVEEDINLEEVLCKRTGLQIERNKWDEGHVGYVVDIKDNSILHVVVAEITNTGNYCLCVVNENNRCWIIDEGQMKKLVLDSREEAEKILSSLQSLQSKLSEN
ncbi:hypothetical protein [Viridibacillus arvi]|uniref:hypothetical protein n=1 Tax=Viridibacillus arvi TaxID=263475 RepID=UPI0034CE292E